MGASFHQASSASVAQGSLQPGPETKEDTAIWSLRHIEVLWSWAARPKASRPAYSPVSSIPYTSANRLAEPDASPQNFPSEPILATAAANDGTRPTPPTVLYLAYGSNMCAKTFLGMRGIRPITQLNVSAPSLDLTFDLPGLPYKEPCFANTAIRKLPEKPPKLPPVPELPLPPSPPTPAPPHPPFPTSNGAPTWNKGLYGVVYEVTKEDYAKIVATEGGGASYHDIYVPCIPLPPPVGVPEKPKLPIPKPFFARTLYAPRLPDVPDHPPPPGKEDASDGPDEDPKKPEPPSWFKKLLLPVRRPSPDYAQPSARYLELLVTGAQEHELPMDYQRYLQGLQAYTITTCRQRIGQVLFFGFWAPLFVTMMFGNRILSDKQGKAPSWWAAVSTILINLVWMSYDNIAKPLFGDGERTMEEEESVRIPAQTFWGRWVRSSEKGSDEEKRCLLMSA
ncbi:hypothetical protein QBC35DRAFT_483556 [Podospora australis]|uniref:gamma-glutamylcyclotransferase n=1 Tax=Podospora australis TaxID=1536484 RepID=A0AAN6X3T3_9PEZI|nr:hypothetical protein QBC35DRAFT_483556 [Podospora australis]